jgi:hypothetical protein
MRRQALGLAAVSLMFCAAYACDGYGDYGVLARYPSADDCYYVDCPIAVGSETRLYVVWTYGKGDSIVAASMEPALADLEVFHGDLLVRPTVAGSARLTVTLASGDVLETPIETEVAASIATASQLTPSTYPAGPPLVFAGSPFLAHAVYKDPMQRPMLGHGLEAWSITGGTLVAFPIEEPAPYPDVIGPDPDRVRRVIAGSDSKVIVSAHPSGPSLEVDVTPAGSTRRLEVKFPNADVYTPNDVSLSRGGHVTVPVIPYAADGRAIFGIPAGGNLVAATDNAAVATVQTLPETRELEVAAIAPGTTQLTVTLDGVTRALTITVY